MNDEWIVVAERVDWNAVEERYMEFFPSKRGRPALGARMALGALIIQLRMKLSDRRLIKEIGRNPYYRSVYMAEYFAERLAGTPGIEIEVKHTAMQHWCERNTTP